MNLENTQVLRSAGRAIPQYSHGVTPLTAHTLASKCSGSHTDERKKTKQHYRAIFMGFFNERGLCIVRISPWEGVLMLKTL